MNKLLKKALPKLDILLGLSPEEWGEVAYEQLVNLGVTSCVAREAARAPERTRKLLARWTVRKEHKSMKKVSVRGQPYRRIIKTEIIPKPGSLSAEVFLKEGFLPREFVLHATKGWRSYRVLT